MPTGWVEVQPFPFMTSALGWGGWSAPRHSRFTPGKDPVPIVRGGGAQGRSARVRKISLSTGIRFPDRPARSESTHQLSYRGPYQNNNSYSFYQAVEPLFNEIKIGILTNTVIIKHFSDEYVRKIAKSD